LKFLLNKNFNIGELDRVWEILLIDHLIWFLFLIYPYNLNSSIKPPTTFF
jgi:hypothetical protein